MASNNTNFSINKRQQYDERIGELVPTQPNKNTSRGYYSPNTKIFEGYRGIRLIANYILNISLIESANVKPSSIIKDYALDNNANIDNTGNYTVNNDQNETDYAEPNNQSGEDVVPS